MTSTELHNFTAIEEPATGPGAFPRGFDRPRAGPHLKSFTNSTFLERNTMENIIFAIGLGAFAVGAVSTVVASRRIARANKARQFALESVDLVNGVLGAGTRVIAAGQIPADSDAGRAILDLLNEVECGCPNHEEERRIKHAAEQAKGGEE